MPRTPAPQCSALAPPLRSGHEEKLAVRLPLALADELKTLAAREANGVSAVVRRLLSTALEREREETVGARPYRQDHSHDAGVPHV